MSSIMDALDPTEEMRQVLEGWCPYCTGAGDEGRIEIVRVGGLPEWLKGIWTGMGRPGCPYDIPEGVEVKEWKALDEEDIERAEGYGMPYPFPNVGGIEFKCMTCGRTWWFEQTWGGDWV